MALFRRSDPDAARDEFAAFYAARGASIRRTAYLLCQDWNLAEDLTQITFIKLFQVWHRVNRDEVLDRYARRVLMRVFLDERRRPWRREHSTAPDGNALDVEARIHPPQERGAVHDALLTVPPRQRAALVYRYWLDLPVEEIAEMMGCSAGTVRSQTARGLERLRSLLGDGVEPPAGRTW